MICGWRWAMGLVLVVAVPQAVAAQPAGDAAVCGGAFHRALEPIRTEQSPVLGGLLANLRRADADASGRWLFANALFTKARAATKPERACVETKSFNGRERCVRFETKPPAPPPAEITSRTAPAAEDMRLLRAVNEIVESKGGLPEVGPNGRQVGLTLRVAQELRGYISQPSHPALCNGVPDMLDFYAAQMAPVKRRADEVSALARQAREAAQTRTRDIAAAEQRLYERALGEAARQAGAAAVAAAKAVADGKIDAIPATSTVATPPRPADAASVADYRLLALPTLIREALRPLLPAAVVNEIAAQPTTMAMLTVARARLLDPETPRAAAPQEVSDAAIAALRMIEASLYADRYVARHADLDKAIGGNLTLIRSAHAGACTCRETD